MRCKNCGWPNKPNETTCVKCGAQLENESQVADIDSGYGGAYQPDMGGDGNGLNKTVMESNVFGDNITPRPRLNETLSDNEKACPKCGYPMRADAIKCPNCNFSVGGTENEDRPLNTTQGGGYQRRPTRIEMPEAPSNHEVKQSAAPTRKIQGGGKLRGTINPYMMNFEQEPAFTLKPIQRLNERKAIDIVELEGSEVVLTRENTEPDNPTITSEDQAVITQRDGHWYIENRSAQKTTFVLAANPIELKSGDVILLGNRMFEFQEQ